MRSRLGLAFSAIYLFIFLISALLALYLLIFHTANSEFSGLYAILVTMPWSLILVRALDAAGYIQWYEHFAGTPALYGFFALLPLAAAAMLNAFLLYLLGALLTPRK